ncbi:hypothetical protein [Lysinibacillus xylanilyticus]|uniref:hypothetical protein n=1 Tax=Lysinibacillus xylanilyticus TaxID=582475 RepID=UPI003D062C9E
MKHIRVFWDMFSFWKVIEKNIAFLVGHRPDENIIEQTETYDIKEVVNPVRIYFTHYENFLDGTLTIDIPLK